MLVIDTNVAKLWLAHVVRRLRTLRSRPPPPVARFTDVLAMGRFLRYHVTPLVVVTVVAFSDICHIRKVVE